MSLLNLLEHRFSKLHLYLIIVANKHLRTTDKHRKTCRLWIDDRYEASTKASKHVLYIFNNSTCPLKPYPESGKLNKILSILVNYVKPFILESLHFHKIYFSTSFTHFPVLISPFFGHFFLWILNILWASTYCFP